MKESEAKSYNQKQVYTGRSPRGYGQTYFAKKTFKRGQKVMVGFGKILSHQTAHCSVQIGQRKHYLPNKWTGRYWNHACEPNTFIKTSHNGFPYLVALKEIKPHEEITYAYWMTELEWSRKAKENWVACRCGSKKCKGKILSYRQLSANERARLNRLCSNYLQNLNN